MDWQAFELQTKKIGKSDGNTSSHQVGFVEFEGCRKLLSD